MQVLIVDDHALFREGLVSLLGVHHPETVVFQAASLADAKRIRDERQGGFDLLLLDLNLGSGNTDRVAEQAVALFPGTPVVVLSGVSDPRAIRAAIEAGAMGFIPKALSFGEFSAALERSLAGEVYLPHTGSHEQLHKKRQDDGSAPAADDAAAAVKRLSRRQLEILRLLVYGLSNRDIAKHLKISEGTVKTHMGHIFPALGVHSRAEAVYLLAQVEHSIGGRDSGEAAS